MRKLVVISVLSLGLHGQHALGENAQGLPHAFEAGWRGQKTCEVLYENASVRVARCEFPPGVGHEKHYHNPHFGYVLEGGTLRIVDDEGERVVTTSAGGTWKTSGITVHEAVNIGDRTTSYLVTEPRVTSAAPTAD